MKKYALALSLVALVGGLSFLVRSSLAAGLETRFFSSNHAYSTVEANQVSELKIAMLPSASVPDSAIEIYLYAVAPTATASDGIADFNAFDIGNITVECPRSIPGVFDFGTPTITTAEFSQISFDGAPYHRIICPYTGSGDVAQADFGFNNDNFLIIHDLINPRSDPDQPNTQLIYSPIWVNFSAAVAQLTVTSARNVQMLATIVPQISLELEGLPAGETYCGLANGQTTSGDKAYFGQVDNEKFADVAQRLTATTNLAGGYVVTAIQDDQLRRTDLGKVVCDGDGTSNDACIPSSQVAGMSAINSVSWGSSAEGQGLGFTLQNEFGSDNVFSYADGYRRFADEQNGDEPAAIMKSAEGRRGVDYVCYRVVASDRNQPGYYTNNITYTLTARF